MQGVYHFAAKVETVQLDVFFLWDLKQRSLGKCARRETGRLTEQTTKNGQVHVLLHMLPLLHILEELRQKLQRFATYEPQHEF